MSARSLFCLLGCDSLESGYVSDGQRGAYQLHPFCIIVLRIFSLYLDCFFSLYVYCSYFVFVFVTHCSLILVWSGLVGLSDGQRCFSTSSILCFCIACTILYLYLSYFLFAFVLFWLCICDSLQSGLVWSV